MKLEQFVIFLMLDLPMTPVVSTTDQARLQHRANEI